jgi:hypothetical protein
MNTLIAGTLQLPVAYRTDGEEEASQRLLLGMNQRSRLKTMPIVVAIIPADAGYHRPDSEAERRLYAAGRAAAVSVLFGNSSRSIRCLRISSERIPGALVDTRVRILCE